MNLEKPTLYYRSILGARIPLVTFISLFVSISINLSYLLSGFPPADDEVRNFLTADGSQVDAYGRVCAFLEALFEHTAATIREEFGDADDAELPSQFRTGMTEGQTFQKPNSFRKAFYREVIQNAIKKFVAAQALLPVQLFCDLAG